MHIRLLVSVLFLASKALGTYVINVDDFFRNDDDTVDEDQFDIEGLLGSYGYPFESHDVTTEDGYILGLHRIPHGKEAPEGENPEETVTKPAVLLMHGMESSSVDFFVLGPERSLALILADIGYDVWLGNNRGNTWSRRHTTLDPDSDQAFWDFSFHEFGVYDDPAIIDYILSSTGNTQVSYIGHSAGNTQFFTMISTKPDYNDKIAVMVALGPAVYVEHLANPIFQLAKDFYDFLESITNSLNINEVLPHSGTLSTALASLCSDDSSYQEICATVLFFIFGFDSDQLDRSLLPIVFQNFPAGTSLKEAKHLLQEIKSGHFRQFDYGEEQNTEVYGKAEPPDYDLSYVVAPVALYYGENDLLVATSDVDRLADELPNVAANKLIEYKNFNHADFLFANDVVSLLYNDIVDLLSVYNGDDLPARPEIPTTPPTTPSTTTSPTTTTDDQKTTPGLAPPLRNSMLLFSIPFLLLIVKLLA